MGKRIEQNNRRINGDRVRKIRNQKSKILINFLFKDIKDKEKELYIGHLERVSNKMSSEETKIALEDLKEMGYTDNIIVATDVVSMRHEKDYDTYIDK